MPTIEQFIIIKEIYSIYKGLNSWRNRRKKRVFLYYGTETEFVRKLKKFLKSMKIDLLTTEEACNSYDEGVKVEMILEQGGCAIIIATPDNLIQMGKKDAIHTKDCVINVAGQAVNRFGERVIHIIEGNVEVEFLSKNNRRSYRFNNDYDEIYTAIVKELSSFKIIR